MRRFTTAGVLAMTLLGLALGPPAWAYPVARALSLTELVKESELIVKVIAGESQMAVNSPYKFVQGFVVHSTEMRVLETYKGEFSGDSFTFLHYAPAQNGQHKFPWLSVGPGSCQLQQW